jgi:hypothetical protein
MIMFIDDHREHLGVEAICKVLPIAPSTYYHNKSIELTPEKASQRAKRDAFIMTRIDCYWEKSRRRYGAVKVWHNLRFNGRIEEVLQSHSFRSGEELETTLHRYVWLYNHQLPQSALGSTLHLQAMKDWHELKPPLFRKQPYHLPGCDI